MHVLFSDDHSHLMSKLRIPRTCVSNWAVEDSCIAYKQSVDTFSLDESGDAERRIMHDVVLAPLDSTSNPLLLHWVANVELASTLLKVPFDTSGIERIGSGVDPVGDVTLDQLRSLLFYCHAREQIRYTVVD